MARRAIRISDFAPTKSLNTQTSEYRSSKLEEQCIISGERYAYLSTNVLVKQLLAFVCLCQQCTRHNCIEVNFMQNNSKRFSEHFGLKASEDGFEFFDLDLYEDTELFIDPYYLSQIKGNKYVSSINRTLKIFMHDLLQLVSNNQRKRAHDLCPRFSETKGTGIGYAKGKISGSGAGEALSTHLVDVMFDSKAITSNNVKNLEECTVVCEGIGKDRASDIVLSVGKLDFIKFTQAQCQKYSIPMKSTQKKLTYFCPSTKKWQSGYFDLPHIVSSNFEEEQYVILIPNSLLSNTIIYDHKYFIRHVLVPYFKKDAIDRKLSCVKIRQNGDKFVNNDDLLAYPEYSAIGKLDINNFVELHPESFEQFKRIDAIYRYNQLKAA